MRTALIARCDRGGLSTQTLEFHRHLHPARTLVVELGSMGRGPGKPDRYGPHGVRVTTDGHPDAADFDWLCDSTDVIFSAETFYKADLLAPRAEERGVRTVLQANPELYRTGDAGRATVLVPPTDWEIDRLPGKPNVLPVPVARDRLPFRKRKRVETFVHPSAHAFHDRNGTEIVQEALKHVDRPCRLLLTGPAAENVKPHGIGHVTVEPRPGGHDDYWEAWPDDADALLLPRRYGGLSLPLQEAASLGMPIVALDLEPQRAWLHPAGLVPTIRGWRANMRGGIFWCHNAAPLALAETMNRLLDSPPLVAEMSAHSDRAAEALSWERWTERYLDVLECPECEEAMTA